jgi:hypothetical protein
MRFGVRGRLCDGKEAETTACRSRIGQFSRPALWFARGLFYIIKAAAHHLSTTSHTTLDPNERLLIPQTFLPRVSTFPAGGLAIVAYNATSSTGVATFGHPLGVEKMAFLICIGKNRAT